MAQGRYVRPDRYSDLKYTELDDIPMPPANYTDDMSQIYYKYATELHEKNLLHTVDIDLLHRYVFAVWMARQSEVELMALKLTDKEFRQVYLTWVQSTDRVKLIGEKFGFNPADKSKVAVPDGGQDDLQKFLELKNNL